MGDNIRLEMVRATAGVMGLVTLACFVLIIFGANGLRGVALMGFIFAGGIFLPTLIGLRNTIRRIAAGRGLVPGDPYRVEGVDPADNTKRSNEGPAN